MNAATFINHIIEDNLTDHANRELRLAGLFDDDSDYDGDLGRSTMELMDVFSKQGHSGMSAHMVVDLFTKLAMFKNLTPLTSDSSEWTDRSDESGQPFWQNKRRSSTFSTDGGKTWYDLEDKDRK